ncbi:hypothetical protein [Polynucleobacter necessarius]|uniref:hypothetical protein n=1 Tax=Polynucleobacter necessarius TaxID=576610 RepID=UPI000E093671|nr:hypothetical protein [Polynucleobacter necessarius]
MNMQSIALFEMAITCSIVLIWIIQQLSQKVFPLTARVVLLILLTNLFFWPIGLSLELPLAAYVRGAFGDLSIVTTLLLWCSLLPNHKTTPLVFKASIALIALGFYPFALGIGMIDPYAWGYGSIIFLIAVIFFALICSLASWNQGVCIIAIAILAWSAHWHESTNLWDYVLDPILAIWAIAAVTTAIFRQRKQKARSGYLFRQG